MSYKWIFLFLLLGFPVSIYLFLQGFGENKFTVPVFYAEGIPDSVAVCEPTQVPFFVSDFTSSKAGTIPLPKGVVAVDLGTAACDSCQIKVNNLAAVYDKYKSWEPFHMVSLVAGEQGQYYPRSYGKWQIHAVDRVEWLEYGRCGLNIPLKTGQQEPVEKNGTVVLVDENRQIRGYYNVFDRKESDRLIVELEILKRNQKTSYNETK